MKRILRKFKKVNKFVKSLFLIILLGYAVSFVLFSKSIISLTGIETIIRYIILIFFICYFFMYLLVNLCKLLEKKYLFFYLTSFISIILIIVFTFGSYFIDLLYDKVSGFNEKDKILYTSYLITLKDTTLSAKSQLGMIEDEDDIEGNVLAKEIIKEHNLTQKVEKYDGYISMLYALYENEIDGIFVSSNYITLFSDEEDFTHLANETKVVYQTSKKLKNEDASLENNKSLSEPITALILGVDSEYDGLDANAAFNGDTLIMATFNPDTFTATLFSIPRDTYVPIACRNNREAKINSSAAYGTNCVIDTIENLTDIDIDYYVKINFKGVVDLVDAVNGVEVFIEEPPQSYNQGTYCKGVVCEQNSNREWGKDTIFIDLGLQTINGEQALAYSRNRHQYGTDFVRNRHQQDVIVALAKKMLTVRSYQQFKDILDAISKNISTNMSTNQILSSYKILKSMVGNVMNDEEFIYIQKSYLETYTLPIVLPGASTSTSAEAYYSGSLEDIVKAMRINLELEEFEYITTFSYSLNEDYQTKVAGQGIRTGSKISLLESFRNKSKADAEEYCSNQGIDCSFKYVDENSQYYDEKVETDLIASQSPMAGVRLDEVSSVTFYINGATSKDSEEDLN